MSMLSSPTGLSQHRWRIAFVFTFFLATFLPISTTKSADQKSSSSSAVDLRGKWEVKDVQTSLKPGTIRTYSGYLMINTRNGNIYRGMLHIVNDTNGLYADQDATIQRNGNSVTIKCTVTKTNSPTWHADSYDLILKDSNLLTGNTEDKETVGKSTFKRIAN